MTGTSPSASGHYPTTRTGELRVDFVCRVLARISVVFLCVIDLIISRLPSSEPHASERSRLTYVYVESCKSMNCSLSILETREIVNEVL